MAEECYLGLPSGGVWVEQIVGVLVFIDHFLELCSNRFNINVVAFGQSVYRYFVNNFLEHCFYRFNLDVVIFRIVSLEKYLVMSYPFRPLNVDLVVGQCEGNKSLRKDEFNVFLFLRSYDILLRMMWELRLTHHLFLFPCLTASCPTLLL